jgi:predicted dehydrogenase
MHLPHGTHQIHIIGQRGQLYGSENVLYHLPTGANEPAKRTFESTDTFAAELAHFADCLREGRRPVHGAEEGEQVLEMILRACESDEGWEQCAVVRV